MQEYLRRSRLGTALDGIGFHVLTFCLSVFWFLCLWGLSFPTLAAGLALYGMVVLLRKKARDDHVARKETQLRAALGGEMALDRLLLSPPERANFEIAMLLSLREPLTLLQAGETGVLCVRKGKNWVISFLQAPAETDVDAGTVLALQREIHLLNADAGLLCVCGKISSAAMRQAEKAPAVSFLSKEKLIGLLGGANPATDDQLVALGRQRKKVSPGRWARHILDGRRGKRYACYGALLLGMYQFTHLLYYAAPGLLCVFLAAACRCVGRKEEIFPEEGP